MATRKNRECPGPEYELIHTRFITLRNGRRLDALDYGLKCFTFWVKRKR